MANALMEQFLPAGATQDKYAALKQQRFYDDIQKQAQAANAMAQAEDPANWNRTAKTKYKKHIQESGGNPLAPSEWKLQNQSLFAE